MFDWSLLVVRSPKVGDNLNDDMRPTIRDELSRGEHGVA